VGVSHQARKYALVEAPTRPVTGFDRPLQAGDRVTFDRRDFFRTHSQVLLVDQSHPTPGRGLQDQQGFSPLAGYSGETRADGIVGSGQEEHKGA